MISIAGLDRAEVLAALYNASKALGMGWLHYDPAPMTQEEAARILVERGDDLKAMFKEPTRSTLQFDYLKGRVMKIEFLAGDRLREWGYDRDNGRGACQRVIEGLRSKETQPGSPTAGGS